MIIENRISIDAPVDLVWKVTAEVESWPKWTPTVTTVSRLDSGPLDVGSEASIKQPGQAMAKWVVTTFDPEKMFEWESRRTGMWFVASHALTTAGSQTVNTLRIEMGGVIVALFGFILRHSVAAALEKENAGLKQYCETLVSSGERDKA